MRDQEFWHCQSGSGPSGCSGSGSIRCGPGGYLALYCSALYYTERYTERLGEIFNAFEVPVPNQILPLIAAMWSLRSVPDYSQPRASHPDGVWRVEPCDPRPRRAEKMTAASIIGENGCPEETSCEQ